MSLTWKHMVAIAVIVLTGILAFNMMLKGWALFLILAALLTWGAVSGLIGKWGYVGALIFAAIAVPAVMLKTAAALFGVFGRLLRLAPFLLVAYGIYALLKGFGKPRG